MPSVSVIILNWNGRSYLDDCLGSLASQSFRDFEVVLLDNGSADRSADYVRARYPWVRLVELPANAGFAGGNNRALAFCRGEYLVTLNNDTRVATDFLQALVAAAAAHPRAGMVAAKMLNFSDGRTIDSVGIRPGRDGMAYNVGVGEADRGQYDRSGAVFGPCAGAALYRRALLDDVGFFDEDFFAYYEDVDLAWRARLAGWEAVAAPRAVVYHVHSGTSGRGSPFTVYHIHRNKWFTLLKNWPTALLWRQGPRIILYDVAALALAALRGRGMAALRARLDVVRHLGALRAKRKSVQAGRRVGDRAAAAWLSHGGRPHRTLWRKWREAR